MESFSQAPTDTPLAWLSPAIGIAAGVAAGFAVAAATDWPLKEGGALEVVLLGGAIGLLSANRIRASGDVDRGDAAGPIRLSVGYARGWTNGSDQIRRAMTGTGSPAEDRHHDLIPRASLSYDLKRGLEVGVDVSGIAAQFVSDREPDAVASEDVFGWSLGLTAGYRGSPAGTRFLSYRLEVGVDRHAMSVTRWFDTLDPRFPPVQPTRSATVDRTDFGMRLGAGVDLYVARDFAVQLGVTRRWMDPVTVPGIGLDHPNSALDRSLDAHSFDLSTVEASVGVAFHF